MKKSFLLLGIFFCALTKDVSALNTRDTLPQTDSARMALSYKKKAKTGFLIGSISLVVGATMECTGLTLALLDAIDSIEGDDPKNFGSLPGVFIIGGLLLMFVSIPLFAAARHNNKKARAMSVSFKPQKTIQPQHYGFVSRDIPSVSFRINL